MKGYTVYMLLEPIHETPIYIGCTSRDLFSRLAEHVKEVECATCFCNKCMFFNAEVPPYTIHDVTIKPWVWFRDKKTAMQMERHCIYMASTHYPLLNTQHVEGAWGKFGNIAPPPGDYGIMPLEEFFKWFEDPYAYDKAHGKNPFEF